MSSNLNVDDFLNKIRKDVDRKIRKSSRKYEKTHRNYDISPDRSFKKRKLDSFEDERESLIYKTLPCNIVNCKGSKCTYAHNIDELRSTPCIYDRFCINRKCYNIHSWESRDEWLKKHNYYEIFSRFNSIFSI